PGGPNGALPPGDDAVHQCLGTGLRCNHGPDHQGREARAWGGALPPHSGAADRGVLRPTDQLRPHRAMLLWRGTAPARKLAALLLLRGGSDPLGPLRRDVPDTAAVLLSRRGRAAGRAGLRPLRTGAAQSGAVVSRRATDLPSLPPLQRAEFYGNPGDFAPVG